MEATEFDIEITNILKKEFENNTIAIEEDTDRYIDEMENHYPFGYSGVDWTKKDNILSLDVKSTEGNRREQINIFFKEILKDYPNLIDEEVIIVGDGALNYGYMIRFENFIELFHLFFELPQDTYVWFLDSKKLINYTFEDELFFG
ncbi:hypothetical protein [Chryseobacterium sp. PMSZPI]|uniref:hypothetical protein n=1 Tax=Chryseobacterium sp. PMSZPI TaxID=1033900 RepID=UPI000C34F48F|nr:hypothetical protein [Chryseobacterium sp. PMSZPI]PKF74193.1 hypothetical protein CW752_09690 [Chryseobacterium sp. PMSZPI]